MNVGPGIGATLYGIATERLMNGEPLERCLSVLTEALIGFDTDNAIKVLKGECELEIADHDPAVMSLITDPKLFVYETVNLSRFASEMLAELEHKYDKVRHLRTSLKERDINHIDIRRLPHSEAVINALAKRIVHMPLDHAESDAWDEYWYRYVYSDGLDVDFIETEYTIAYAIDMYMIAIGNLAKHFVKFANIYDSVTRLGIVDHLPMVEDIIEQSLVELHEFCRHEESHYHHPLCDDRLEAMRRDMVKSLHTTSWCGIQLYPEYLANRIFEKNPDDAYDAAWIDPEGRFYGMCGKISGFMHLEMSEKLSVKYNIDGPNYDFYLNDHSWIKLSGNKVHVHLCDKKTEQDGVVLFTPTDKQIETLCRFIKANHNGMLMVLGRTFRCSDIQQMDEYALHEAFYLY